MGSDSDFKAILGFRVLAFWCRSRWSRDFGFGLLLLELRRLRRLLDRIDVAKSLVMDSSKAPERESLNSSPHDPQGSEV